jgi:hypothetical protein
MGRVIDEVGNRYGRWLVLKRAGQSKAGQTVWLTECDCGQQGKVLAGNLRSGRSRSCGCLQREGLAARATTHGMRGYPEYMVWLDMVKRCENPKAANFHNYGGRGIEVCPQWRKSFETFYQDMGARPSTSHSLERVDNSLGYDSVNCTWATRKEQCRNRRTNKLLAFQGVTMCVAAWADKIGISNKTLSHRVRDLGWPIEKALTTSVRKQKNNVSMRSET